MKIWVLVIASSLIIFLPIGLALILRRNYRAPWFEFCVGILTFLGAQVVHLPLNRLLAEVGLLPVGATAGSSLFIMAAILGLTAGLTEELARAIGYAVVRRARQFQDGIMMGLGHGGIEVMILSALTIASAVTLAFLVATGTLPANLSPEQSAALDRQLELLTGTPMVMIVPAVERVIALILQVCLSVMVLQAFVRRNWLYVVAAILIHAVFDFVAVIGVNLIDNIWILEGMLALFTIPLILWVWRLKPAQVDRSSFNRLSFSHELNIFNSSLSKEFLYQWRSKRVIIICAVFLIFGMISPLLAKFTPQLLGNLEGAEQFAELIPEPTTSDALSQYIRNLTQFGFILVILLGMGAIAGEKEKGTAALILSKPLPRGSFVASKFIAQAAVYVLAFILAGIAAFYYTTFLFENANPVSFLIICSLLVTWLLVFAAITLLGSAIGQSVAASAGISLLGSVLILLLGTIPQISGLTPSGLVAWANQLAAGDVVSPNPGAISMSVVLVLILLITAMAVFEEQEL